MPDLDAVQPTQSPTATFPPTRAPTVTYRDCIDLDVDHNGHVLSMGYYGGFLGCDDIGVDMSDPYTCGMFDTPRSESGGSYGANDPPGFTEWLENWPADQSLTASVDCCACGGGTHPFEDCVDIGDRDECDLHPYPECEDTAGNDVEDSEGHFNPCSGITTEWGSHNWWELGYFDRACDMYDDGDFTARTMCCACGGGRSTVVPGQNCNASDATLNSTRNCCVCGGGNRPTMPPTLSPTGKPTAAPSSPPGASGAASNDGDDGTLSSTIAGLVVAGVALVALGCIAYYRAKMRQQRAVADYIPMDTMEDLSITAPLEGVEGRSDTLELAALRGANSESELEIVLPDNCPYVRNIVSRKETLLTELKIDPMRLAIGQMVGSGQFGQVFIGTLNPTAVNVAIKMVKAGAGLSAANEELAEEAAVTGTFNHPNIVKALGVYQADKCWRLVLEYCGKGALQTLLSDFATAGTAAGKTDATIVAEYGLPRLLRYATELASAMEYLSDLKFVHRDLAARNALVSDEDTAKLADFGMSRKTGAEDAYVAVTQRPQPLRWMAPESIELMTFTSETDMWSFGVMAWEIFAMGAQPYNGVSNLMIYKVLVVDGTRLQCPVGCPESIYAALGPTWLMAPGTRPRFAELHNWLQSIQIDDAAAAPPVTEGALIAVNADYRLVGASTDGASAAPAQKMDHVDNPGISGAHGPPAPVAGTDESPSPEPTPLHEQQPRQPQQPRQGADDEQPHGGPLHSAASPRPAADAQPDDAFVSDFALVAVNADYRLIGASADAASTEPAQKMEAAPVADPAHSQPEDVGAHRAAGDVAATGGPVDGDRHFDNPLYDATGAAGSSRKPTAGVTGVATTGTREMSNTLDLDHDNEDTSL